MGMGELMETFAAVLAALIVYRLLRFVGTEVIRAWVRYDRESRMARQMKARGSASWSGARSRPWRLMQRLGIEEARTQ